MERLVKLEVHLVGEIAEVGEIAAEVVKIAKV